eukprot:358813-Chlamydomonas_euryale.AAC.8
MSRAVATRLGGPPVLVLRAGRLGMSPGDDANTTPQRPSAAQVRSFRQPVMLFSVDRYACGRQLALQGQSAHRRSSSGHVWTCEGRSRFRALVDRGAVMATIAKSLGANFFSDEHATTGLEWVFQPTALVKDREPTKLELRLDRCAARSAMTAERLSAMGWHSNATQCKGRGRITATFAHRPSTSALANKADRRTFLSSACVDQLPSGISRLLPVIQTDKSGIAVEIASSLLELTAEGVPMALNCRTANQGLQTCHATAVSGFYEQQVEMRRAITPQELEPKPPMKHPQPCMPAEIPYHPKFIAQVYRTLAPQLTGPWTRLKGEFAGSVVCIDANFKLHPGGITTALDELGLPLATWIETSSMWALAGPLAALGRRCKLRGKPIRVVYVDNPFHVRAAPASALPELGKGLGPW